MFSAWKTFLLPKMSPASTWIPGLVGSASSSCRTVTTLGKNCRWTSRPKRSVTSWRATSTSATLPQAMLCVSGWTLTLVTCNSVSCSLVARAIQSQARCAISTTTSKVTRVKPTLRFLIRDFSVTLPQGSNLPEGLGGLVILNAEGYWRFAPNSPLGASTSDWSAPPDLGELCSYGMQSVRPG